MGHIVGEASMFGLFKTREYNPDIYYAGKGYVWGAVLASNNTNIDLVNFASKLQFECLKEGATKNEALSARWGFVYSTQIHDGTHWYDAIETIKRVRLDRGLPYNFTSEDESKKEYQRAGETIMGMVLAQDRNSYDKFLKALRG